MDVIWTDYMLYRIELRGFEQSVVEEIVRHSSERYIDTATGRLIVVGRHNDQLVVIPYEMSENSMVPVTIHTTTRRQNQLPDPIRKIYA